MSHHGLQVLYTLMNDRADWACERAFAPWPDMEAAAARGRAAALQPGNLHAAVGVRRAGLHAAVRDLHTNLLAMLDLGGIPLHCHERTMDDPLVIAGGPCAQNPEPLAPFIDLFVIGDGEPSLPLICDAGWNSESCRRGADLRAKRPARARGMLAELAARAAVAYVPGSTSREYHADGRLLAIASARAPTCRRRSSLR